MRSISRRTVLRGMAGAAALAALPDLTSAIPAAAATAAGQKGLVGASVFSNAYPNVNRLQAGSIFDGFVLRPVCSKVQRVYYPPGTFPTSGNDPQDVAGLVSAGMKVVISFRPDPAGGDVARLRDGLTYLKTIPNIDFEVALWHEANNDTQTFPSNTLYHDFVSTYAPTVRAHGVPLVYIPLITLHAADSALTYYPGATLTDKILADFYGNAFLDGARLEPIMAKADAVPMPFGISEWGDSGQPSPIGPTDFGTYVAYLVTLMTGRLAAGKNNADIIWFDGGGPNNNITAADDFRVPGVAMVADALSA